MWYLFHFGCCALPGSGRKERWQNSYWQQPASCWSRRWIRTSSSNRSSKSSLGRSKGRKREVTEDGAYDIFISYAHRTPAEASRLHKTLLDLDPNLKIFLDRSELKTGNIQTLERLQI